MQSTTPRGTVSKLLVPDVLYVPELTINLLSLPVLDRRGISAHAANGQMVFKRGNQHIATAILERGTYLLKSVEAGAAFRASVATGSASAASPSPGGAGGTRLSAVPAILGSVVDNSV